MSNQSDHEYYLRNKAHILESTRQYRKQHPEVSRKSRNKRKAADPEGFRERERIRAQKKRYRMKLARTNDAFVDRLIESWKLQRDFTCYYCQDTFPISRLNVEHIVPIFSGGKHTVANVCKSCDLCNQKKHFKPLSEFEMEQPVLCL